MLNRPEMSDTSAQYLAAIEARMRETAPREVANRVRTLVATHDYWRARHCLNMNPAESLLSLRCRQLLATDMATRLTEGFPGNKLYPHGRQNEFIDEIEGIVVAQARGQFGATFVEWRPVSTSMAAAITFFALLRRGDVILSQDADGGGNYVYHKNGPAGLLDLQISSIPTRGAAFELDLDALADRAMRFRPALIAIGGSNVLFPYPVREVRQIADRVGALVLYDAAHLGLLISSGDFQRPLAEGAHVVILSTHKVMGGPVGGLILMHDREIARKVSSLSFPAFMQTRDQNKYAALAMALAETAAFGAPLAAQMLANAQALAQALHSEGFDVIAADRGYTRSHQIFLNLGNAAQEFESRCQAANILVSDCALTGDLAHSRRTGARLATHELTRLGMKEAHMQEIARLIRRVARDAEESGRIAAAVAALLRDHQRIQFSFDDAGG